MKKYLIAVLLSACTFLSGCDQYSGYTSVEKTLMKQCTKNLRDTYGDSYSCFSQYTVTDDQIEASSQTNPEDKPFAQQALVFKLEDRAFKEKFPKIRSINELWYESTGQFIIDDSNYSTRKSNDEVKKVGDTFVLSPQMYDELINAVRTCNRATISATQFPIGSKLSPEDYNKVMNIILDCKQYQLDEAINKK